MSLSLSLYLQDFVYVAGTHLINSERWRPQTYSGSCLMSGSVQDLFNLTEIYTNTRRWEKAYLDDHMEFFDFAELT